MIKGNRAAVDETKRKVSQILDRHRKSSVDLQHVKTKYGVKAYLREMGTMPDVCYPQHWKKDDWETDARAKVPLPPQSRLYQQIVKLVEGTWDGTMVGIGFDGTGLGHNKIVVTSIFACKNGALFRQYDTTRKNLCRDASVNQYTAVNGCKGEQEVATREHITGN